MDSAFSSSIVSPFLKSKQVVGLFWSEKIWLLVDYLQLYGLLWNAANPWPWPYLWIHWTKWTVWSNIDYFSYSPEGALNGGSGNVDISKWGQMDNYFIYAACFAFPMFIAFALFAFYLDKSYFLAYGSIRHKERQVYIKYSLTAAHLLYLPVCLAVFRIYYCNSDTELLACDPSVACNSTGHIAALVLITLANAPLVAGLPYVTYRYTDAAVIYSLEADHEKRMQVWELMYMLDLDSAWLDGQMWMFSSFKRNFMFFRLEMLLLKFVSLVVFVFMRENLVSQAALLWLFFTAFSVRYLYHSPYRLVSTNAQLKVLMALLMANVSFGLMNAMGTESAVMVASVETIWLLSINVVGLLVILAMVVLSILNPFAAWPSDATLSGMQHNPNGGTVKKYVKWICCLHNYNRFRARWYTGTRSNVDINGLEELIRLLRKFWLSARAMGSLFAIPIGESLEDLLIMREHVAAPQQEDELAYNNDSVIFRRKDFWNVMLTGIKAGNWGSSGAPDGASPGSPRSAGASFEYQSLLSQRSINRNALHNRFAKPHDYSLGEPRPMEDILRTRDANYALMPPVKKRILTKLLAMRALMGTRRLAKYSEEDEQRLRVEAMRKAGALEGDVLKTYKLVGALKKVSAETFESFKSLQSKHQEQMQAMASAMSPTVASSSSAGGPNDPETPSSTSGTFEGTHGGNLAQLEASYSEMYSSLDDLVNEWSNVLDLLEKNDLPGVPHVTIDEEAFDNDGDLEGKDGPTVGRALRGNVSAEEAEILKKHALEPFSTNDTEEWYTYRMMLRDRLSQVEVALNALGSDDLVRDSYDTNIITSEEPYRRGSHFSEYAPSPVDHYGSVAVLQQLEEAAEEGAEQTAQRMGLHAGGVMDVRGDDSAASLPSSDMVVPSSNSMLLESAGSGKPPSRGSASALMSPVDDRGGGGGGPAVDGYEVKGWAGGDDEDDDNV